MIENLIIVESPTKANTINKFLGKNYIVKSSMGHIRDLPEKSLGVDIKNNFVPVYVIAKKKLKIVKELQELVKQSQKIYIATDEDREGEAIGWHLIAATKVEPKRIRRIVFHEITKEVIEQALKNPRDIDMNLVNAQQTRRILDRLVGYKISPLLGKKIYAGLSAGRVQSVALRLIVEREREIEKFVPQEYWTIKAELKKLEQEIKFQAILQGKGDKKFDKLDLKNKEVADQIINELKEANYLVEKITRKETKRNPSPPFITSTLQQEAFRKLGFSASKTMLIAQQLYEGIDLKEKGLSGLITYMRTDSFNVSTQAQNEAKMFIGQRYGDKYLPETPRIYKTKVKGAQEAHEAIRPTSVKNIPEEIRLFLTPDQYKLYNLIWQRFVASFMSSAIFDNTIVDIRAKDYLFRATGQILKFAGFMEVYVEEEEDSKDKEITKLPPLQEKENLQLIQLLGEQHFTEPPSRYNEATLIKTLEKYGIGRPSTYAPIINTIITRGYVKLEEKKFRPQKIGLIVNDLLKDYFPEVIDIAFTAQMEEELDEIAEGKKDWVSVLNDFYRPFEKTLQKASEKIKSSNKGEPTSEKCTKCGAQMVIKRGRYGKFLACSRFPQCKTTVSIDEKTGQKKKIEFTQEKCPKCGKMMVVREGRRGKFLACSGYPKCKTTAPLKDKGGS